MSENNDSKYLMENAVSPDHKVWVDKARFMAMKDAVFAVLPTEAPGMTASELREAIRPILSQEHFPGGEKAGWWMKGVQLDQEFKGAIARGSAKPVKLYRVV